MNAQEYMAEQIERMGPILAHYVATTAPDKLTWQPHVEGSAPTRSVLEQIGECIVINHHFAALLRGEEPTMPANSWKGPDIGNSQDAQNQLLASTTELAQAVRTFSDADMQRAYTLRRGVTTGSNLIMMAHRNMAYHAGQINLIQLLTGDSDFHMPPAWY